MVRKKFVIPESVRKIWDWLFPMREWLASGVVLHIVVAIWTIVLGLLVYGFSEQVWQVALIMAGISFVASGKIFYPERIRVNNMGK